MNARINVKVRPRAKVTRLTGETAGAVKIDIAAPPVDGKANDELIRFLSELTGVRRSGIQILAGETSAKKLVSIDGISQDQLTEILQ